MNPYLLTLIFLSLMSILTSSEMVRLSQNHLGDQLHTHYQKNVERIQEMKAHAALDDFRAQVMQPNEPKPQEELIKKGKSSSARQSCPSLGFNLCRPPNNSRFNLYSLLHEEPHKDYPLNFYEVIARLIHSLYSKALYFKKIPNIEYRILNALIKHKEQTLSFTTPDELGTLPMEDKSAQEVFYLMLKGSEGFPSLLNYITFDQNGTRDMKKINLMFADPCLIEAIFDNLEISARVLTLRDGHWEQILDQEMHRLERSKEECKGRNIFKKELQQGLEEMLLSFGLAYNNYKWVFDLSLGKLGNVLFLENSETGFIQREKF